MCLSIIFARKGWCCTCISRS